MLGYSDLSPKNKTLGVKCKSKSHNIFWLYLQYKKDIIKLSCCAISYYNYDSIWILLNILENLFLFIFNSFLAYVLNIYLIL
jgi:hypothetical protein